MNHIVERSHVDPTARLYRQVRVTDSTIGADSIVCDNVDVIRSEVADRCVIGRRNLFIESSIGDGSYTGSNSEVRNCTIGKYCNMSWNLALGGANHNYRAASMIRGPVWGRAVGADPIPSSYAPSCVIGNDVWIASSVTVISGVTVGDGAVLGAGSVVVRDIPPYAIAVGVPAKVIKYRFPQEIIDRLLALKWWDWELADIRTAAPLLQQDLDESVLAQLEAIVPRGC